MKYLILSSGAYSDYDPTYYFCENPTPEITQDMLDRKAKEITKRCVEGYERLPDRKHVCQNDWCCSPYKKLQWEKYFPDTGKIAYDPYHNSDYENIWWKEIIDFVENAGYQAIPDELPELNISYSDYPS